VLPQLLLGSQQVHWRWRRIYCLCWHSRPEGVCECATRSPWDGDWKDSSTHW